MRREESRTRNRAALVSTARELFLSDGYQATSIAKVAAESGFTTGAVYSNFDGKAQLALVVLREIKPSGSRS
ncbi:TetR family transcriptional regulator [Actinokineospora soli]|uniref:TetR family transcriptional regulator n=1 Tax=Actinokineospora soli TaxID=1048753 RepID=A0ABW2TQU6_9PSEU